MNFRMNCGSVESWLASPYATYSSSCGRRRWYANETFHALVNAGAKRTSTTGGVRRIIGTPPVVDVRFAPAFTSAWNVSFAYHRRLPHDELYVAYGDASQLSTLPQFILKFIHYFGAEKGT